MNRERLLADAKARALSRVKEGYSSPALRNAIRVGGDAVSAPLKLGIHLAWRAGRISDHDDMQSDYFAGCFVDNISQAISMADSMNRN